MEYMCKTGKKKGTMWKGGSLRELGDKTDKKEAKRSNTVG